MSKWNQRYDTPEFIYGKEPNSFFKSTLEGLHPGKLLLPAEGEGRNAVFAAKAGWEVYAIDSSIVAKEKAEKFARESSVAIHYQLGDITNYSFDAEFNVIGFFYAHLFPGERAIAKKIAMDHLRKNGILMIEGFSKEQLQYNSGGPKAPELLYDLDELMNDLHELTILKKEKITTNIKAGTYHNGQASIIRIIGQKK